MSKLAYIAFVALCATSSNACRKDPLFCEGAPHNDCSFVDAAVDAPPDAPDAYEPECTSTKPCTGALGVCELVSMTCVQCTPTAAAACTGTTPTCAGTTCHACTAHNQCASNVCLPDGSCGDDTNVAYVDPSGTDNATCTKLTPCTKVAKALATDRPFLKFHGTNDEAVTISGGKIVTFLADVDAKLTRGNGTGAIITVKDDGTLLTIHDLSVSDAPNNPSGIGILIPTGSGGPTISLKRVKIANNPGGGISAAGGQVTLTQSTVSGNTSGGISISGAQFDITNNVISTNGGGASVLGGVRIDGLTTTGIHILDFNTITANLGPGTINTGITCGTVLIPLLFANNIVYANIVSGGGVQIGGSANCATTYSDIGPDTVAGTGNINLDPMFVSASQNDFHLLTRSPAKDAANPSSTIAIDIDGDARPQGLHSDMGADEFKP